METANVGLNEETVTPNMVVTYPGKHGIEISTKGQSINVKAYLKEVGSLGVKAPSNSSEKAIREYLAKYYPKELEEYEAKKAIKADEGR